jgi:hypothetical protein
MRRYRTTTVELVGSHKYVLKVTGGKAPDSVGSVTTTGSSTALPALKTHDQRNTGDHQERTRQPRPAQRMFRDTDQPEVVNRDRGYQIRADSQPVQRAHPNLLHKRQPGEYRNSADDAAQRRPPLHVAQIGESRQRMRLDAEQGYSQKGHQQK